MSTIANLVVEISAKSNKLKSELTKSEKNIKTFAANSVKTVSKIGAALTASFAVVSGLLVNSISKTADEIDKLAKTSAKLGVGISALQELGLASELAGVSSETLGTGLQRMVRRVSEAAKGTGAAKDALKELGLVAEDLVKLSPDEQFKAIGRAMETVSSQGDKVRLAMKVFDTEGVGLLNVFGQNLDAISDKFNNLQLGLTETQAKAVESFNDSKTVLGTIFDSFKQQVTAAVAPAFQAIIESVSNSIERMGGLRSAAASFAKVLVQGLGASIDVFKGFAIALDAILLTIDAITVGFEKMAGAAENVGNSFKALSLSKFKEGFGLGEAAFELFATEDTAASQRLSSRASSLGETPRLDALQGAISGAADKINVNVTVNAKTKELFDFVVDNPEFNDKVSAEVANTTQNSRRRTTR